MISEELSKVISLARKREFDYPSQPFAAVEDLLPHRHEMLMIDAIKGVSSDGNSLRASRRISNCDQIFKGHFPRDPVYPGVLLIEIIAQAAACLIILNLHKSKRDQCKVRALRILHAEFLGSVLPGDDLEVDVFLFEAPAIVSTVAGRIRVRGTICATAVVTIYVES